MAGDFSPAGGIEAGGGVRRGGGVGIRRVAIATFELKFGCVS